MGFADFLTDSDEIPRKQNPFSWEFPIDSLANFNESNRDSLKRVLSFRHINEKREGNWRQETAQFTVLMFEYRCWKFPIAYFNFNERWVRLSRKSTRFFIAVILEQPNRLEFQTSSVDCSTMTAWPTSGRIVISLEIAENKSQ